MKRIIHTVGNMVDIPDSNHIALHVEKNKIVFVGKMSYEPNIIAVTFFVKNIFPVIKKKYPRILFYIVGANPDERVLVLNKTEGVIVTGYVDKIEKYFRESTVVIAPMLTGAGIQNKIIQAMSYGCCVVTTSIGAEGLDIKNNEISIIDSKDQWIEQLSRLLSDRELRLQMGDKARNYIIKNHSKKVVAEQFWNFINSVCTS